MAVIRCEEIPSGRSGSQDYKGGRRYVRLWQVEVDSDFDGPLVVLGASGLPPVGFPYVTSTESDGAATVKSRDPQQQEDPRIWHVTVEYSNQVETDSQSGGGSGEPGEPGASPENRPENPINRPAVWSLDFVEEQRAVLEDLDGFKVTNSAGDLFDPPFMRTVFLPQFTAVKNYATFSFYEASTFFNKVNSDAWKGFPAKTVRTRVKLQSQFENGVGFVQATWTFTVDLDGWNPTWILDQGPNKLEGGERVPLANLQGQGYVGRLDGAGGELAAAAANVFLDFRFHDEISFAAIP